MIQVVIPFYKNQTQLDKCRSFIPSKIPVIVINDSESGNGFTWSVNEGLKKAFKKSNTGYALILNQDCYLGKQAVDKMVEFMDKHPKCAIAGIKQLSDKNPDEIIHGGTGECFPAGKHEGGLVSSGDCNRSKQVPWVNGACMIVRLQAVLEIGLMDPNYKMFGSDADWSFEARNRGWETWYIAEADCIHEQGASKGQDEKMAKVFEADMRYFRDRWLTDELYRDLSMEVFS